MMVCLRFVGRSPSPIRTRSDSRTNREVLRSAAGWYEYAPGPTPEELAAERSRKLALRRAKLKALHDLNARSVLAEVSQWSGEDHNSVIIDLSGLNQYFRYVLFLSASSFLRLCRCAAA